MHVSFSAQPFLSHCSSIYLIDKLRLSCRSLASLHAAVESTIHHQGQDRKSKSFSLFCNKLWLVGKKCDIHNLRLLYTSSRRDLNLNLPFSHWHFGHGLFDLLIMTFQGQTCLHLVCSLRTLIWPRKVVISRSNKPSPKCQFENGTGILALS